MNYFFSAKIRSLLTKQVTYWIICCVVFVSFLSLSLIKLDPDFGWHKRMGEEIVQHGITETEYFTYSMPDYPFIDFEWGSHLVWGVMFPIIGSIGLAVLYALCAISAIMFVLKDYKNILVKNIVLILASAVLMEFIGIRVQIISWMFFVVVLYVFLFKEKSRLFFFSPLIFLLWANVHGAFVLGLALFGIKLISDVIFHKSLIVKSWVVFVISVLVTLLNPYGVDLWRETIIIATDSQLRWSISEWVPTIFFIGLSVWIYSGISIILFFFYRKKLNPTHIVLLIVTFVSGISSIRNIPYWIFCSALLLYPLIPFIESRVARIKFGKVRFQKSLIFLFFIAIVVFAINLASQIRFSLNMREGKFYPLHAVEYLQKNAPGQNVFSTYDWGGYLIWKLPEKEVFIDGRMSSWSVERGESRYNVFDEYKEVMRENIALSKLSRTYSIDTILLPSDHQNLKKQLQKEWVQVYRDDISVIYKKIK